MSGERLNSGANGPEQIIEQSADKRAEYTKGYFPMMGKTLAEFADEVNKAYPAEINIDINNAKSLTLGILKLQRRLGFHETMDKKGCDGICGPYTFKAFMERKIESTTDSALATLRGDIGKGHIARTLGKDKQESRGTSKAKTAPKEDPENPQQPAPTETPVHIESYRPGPNRPTFSPKAKIAAELAAMYQNPPTKYFNGFGGKHKENLYENFDQSQIVTVDPITHEQITFLGRPIAAGINLHMIPFLKMVEEELDGKINYKPKAVLGFQDRDINQQGHPRGEKNGMPSFHKLGLALDLDASENGADSDRGTIPDEVFKACAKFGLALGIVHTNEHPELGGDPMHIQLRWKADDPAAQALINASPAGRKYWEKIAPMLTAMRTPSRRALTETAFVAPTRQQSRKSKTETRVESNNGTVDRSFWYRTVGDPMKEPKKVEDQMCKIDPFTHGPLTFFKHPVRGGCHPGVYAYLKEVEKRLEMKGKSHIAEKYIYSILGFKIRPTAEPDINPLDEATRIRVPPKPDAKPSPHSWGYAFDFNAERNPYGAPKEDLIKKFGEKGLMPDEFVKIMEEVGFSWGGRWAKPDWMHFNFDRDPAASTHFITTDIGKKYAAALIPGYRQKNPTEVVAPITPVVPIALPTPRIPERTEPTPPAPVRKRAKTAPSAAPSPKPRAFESMATRIRTKLEPYKEIIQRASAKYGVDEDLIRAVMWNESTGVANISNVEGAGGLMQLIPMIKPENGVKLPTFRPVKTGKGYFLDERDWRADPEKNIMAGTKLLAENLKTFGGNIILTLAAYNAGAGAVKKAKGVPDKEETQKYVINVPNTYNKLKAESGDQHRKTGPDQAVA